MRWPIQGTAKYSTRAEADFSTEGSHDLTNPGSEFDSRCSQASVFGIGTGASVGVGVGTGAMPAALIFSEKCPTAPKIENRENKTVPTPKRAKADADADVEAEATEEVFFQFFLHS